MMLTQCICSLTDPRLEELNVQTFAAEERQNVGGVAWDAFLLRILSEDFWIRRANPAIPLQNKRGMIAHIRHIEPVPRQICGVESFQDGDYGVVTCMARLEGRPDYYHHLKTFVRSRQGEWQCVYWRIAILPAP